ncbi:MAG: DUF1080 domain-containing protein [Planctomycetaceae bacterium]|nr:DUF1080 domain-containing protein [Planctomycetaceae bacterium]
MPRFTSLLLLLCLMSAGSLQAGEWKMLFDGSTLEGWTQKNGTATYRVEKGTIVGQTSEGSPNSFLCSNQEYGDFELEFSVKVHDRLNSGVQIRSQAKPPANDQEKYGRVNGPQVEIEASLQNGAEAGYIYGEATGRGWLTPEDKLIPHKVMKDGEWNHFRVIAKGPRIQTWINGQQISDLTDEEIYKTHPKGFIGLQVHGIPKGTGPYDVAWKEIRIKTLD